MIWLTTSQIGEMSRKRTNSAESSIARPVEKTTSEREDQRQLKPAEHRRHAGDEREQQHDDEVEQQVEERQQHDRKRDDHARELDLAHQVLAVEDTAYGPAGGFAEESEQHDRAEQLHAVESFAGLASLADVGDEHEEHIQHAEQQAAGASPATRSRAPSRRTSA